MHLHRAHADVELIGDQFVGQAFHHQTHDVTLALGQVSQFDLQVGVAAPGLESPRRHAQRLLDAVHQGIVGKRLLAEVERPALDRIHGRRHVGMAGEKNHRHQCVQLGRNEPVKQGQPAGARHTHIQQQATGAVEGTLRQHALCKRVGTVEQLAVQAPRPQQPGQRLAHTGIVVHDVHHHVLCRFHH